MSEHPYEQNRRESPVSLWQTALITGFFGGIFWGFIGLIGYAFHFTEIRPNMILEPWARGEWKSTWPGTLISLLLLGLSGTLAASIYYLTMKKFRSVWAGILYGILLFAIVFFVFNPMFPTLNPIGKLNRNTIVTTVCLFISFGVFTGYTISYEYEEQRKERERMRDGKDGKE